MSATRPTNKLEDPAMMAEKHRPGEGLIRTEILLILGLMLLGMVTALWWASKPAQAPGDGLTETSVPSAPAAVSEAEPAIPSAEPAPTAPASPVERDWGVRVSKLALARENTVIDLRFEITDLEKAGLLAGSTNSAYLLDVASGTEIGLAASPEEQPLRNNPRTRSYAKSLRLAGEFPPPSGRLVTGRTYSALLPNPSGIIKSGTKMSLVIGTSRVDNLIVE